MVARFVRDEEVVGSNPATPTHHRSRSGALHGGLFCLTVYGARVDSQRKVIKHVTDELVSVVWTVGVEVQRGGRIFVTHDGDDVVDRHPIGHEPGGVRMP